LPGLRLLVALLYLAPQIQDKEPLFELYVKRHCGNPGGISLKDCHRITTGR
jgi:hypothetical protein